MNQAIKFALISFLSVLIIPGVYNTYPSPFAAGFNQQVTTTDANGYSFFLDNMTEILPDKQLLMVDNLVFPQRRWMEGLRGASYFAENIRFGTTEPPVHFGYTKYSKYGESIKTDRYFLSQTLSSIYYSERVPEYPQGWQWSPDDFEQLVKDPSVAKFYANGGFDAYYVTAYGQ